MASIKQELVEEEMQPITSGGGEHKGKASDFDSDKEFDDSFTEEYCEKAEIPKLMAVSKDTMV